VVAGGETVVDLYLAAAPLGTAVSEFHLGTIAGRICERNPANGCVPLANARVGYRVKDAAPPTVLVEVVTDSQGFFAIANVVPAHFAYYAVAVIVQKHDQRAREVDRFEAGAT